MDVTPQLFDAKVVHKRLFPRENSFSYGVYYLALPLPAASVPGPFIDFPASDLGYRDGCDPDRWARDVLRDYQFEPQLVHHIMVVTMPRVFGYVFNPVSFYLCLDEQKQLRAVIAEVHNTFGEQHSYLCAHPDHAPLSSHDWLEAEKLFHVSPFLRRLGRYRFRFSLAESRLGIWIDYYDDQQNKQLLTSLTGTLTPLTARSLRRFSWKYPLVTLKTILLIHWQAIKLLIKRAVYVAKPEQNPEKTSATLKLKKHEKS